MVSGPCKLTMECVSHPALEYRSSIILKFSVDLAQIPSRHWDTSGS